MSSVSYNTKPTINTHLLNTSISSAVKMIKYQNIAPAPPSDLKTRKYMPRASNGPYGVDQTHSVQRRNARERNRVKQVNNSFAKLRQHIPQTIITDLTKGGGRGPHKKISKVDTLRIAVEYIRRLQDLVEDLNSNCGGSDSASSNGSLSSGSMAGSPPPSAQLYYTNAPSPLPAFQQAQQLHLQQFSTTMSLNAYSPHQIQLSAGCHSPTSSFNSSMSYDSGTFESSQQLSPPPSGDSSTPALNGHLQLKFEPYDNFQMQEEDCTPDDEEILDYISLWQEQ